MGSIRTKRTNINYDLKNDEFERGKREWKEWIKNKNGYNAVIQRRKRASDPYEKAFFIGVLTGHKVEGTKFPPPKNWKGQICGGSGKIIPLSPNPRMVKRKR